MYIKLWLFTAGYNYLLITRFNVRRTSCSRLVDCLQLDASLIKGNNLRGKHKGMVVVPYVKGLREAYARILKSHGIATGNRPHWMLRTTSRMRRLNWSTASLAKLLSSYIGEASRNFGLRIKEHIKYAKNYRNLCMMVWVILSCVVFKKNAKTMLSPAC